MDMYSLLDGSLSKKKILIFFLILIAGIYYCTIVGEMYYLEFHGKNGNKNDPRRKNSVSDKLERDLEDFIAQEERKVGNILDTGGQSELHRRLLAEDELLAENFPTRKVPDSSRTRPSRIIPSVPERKRCNNGSPLYYGTKMTEARLWKKISNGLEAFSAFLVNRNGQNTVEIISRGNVSVPYCLLWYSNVPWTVSSFVKASFKYSSQNTTVLSCDLPKEDKRTIPSAVSLTEKPCQRTNNIFKVLKTADYPGISVGICLKLFDAHPSLDSVIELLERAREQDIEKVTIYGMNNQVDFALRSYVKERLVEIIGSRRNLAPSLILPLSKQRLETGMEQGVNGDLSEAMKQDCLRRNRGTVRFAIVMSVDEIIYPTTDATMATALQRLMSRDIDVYKIDTSEYIVERDNSNKHAMKADLRTYELKNGSSSPNMLHIYDLNHGGNRTVFPSVDKIRALRLREGKQFEKLKRIVYPVRLYHKSDDKVRRRFFKVIEGLMEQDAKIRLAKKQMVKKVSRKFEKKIPKGRTKM